MQGFIRNCAGMLPLLAVLQASLCSALAINPISSLAPRNDYSEKNFDFLKVQHATGLNPYYFLAKPALSLPRVSVCLPREYGEPHVDGCNIAFDNIPNLRDKNGNFAVKPGQCRAINAQCCQVTVCAPRALNLLVPATEVHLQVTKAAANCTTQHLGSIYMDNGWDYLIMVHKPKDLNCWPDDGKKTVKAKRFWEAMWQTIDYTKVFAWPSLWVPDEEEKEQEHLLMVSDGAPW